MPVQQVGLEYLVPNLIYIVDYQLVHGVFRPCFCVVILDEKFTLAGLYLTKRIILLICVEYLRVEFN